MTDATATALTPLAVTMGDPAGIGIEITLMAWQRRRELALPPFALYADPSGVAATAARLGIAAALAPLDREEQAASAFATHLPIRPVTLARAATPGQPDSANGPAVVSAIDTAAAAVLAGRARAVVTNPIAKSVLHVAGFTHPGHTEYMAVLAERARPGTRYVPVMMLACDELRVVPLTVHVPIAAVPRLITPALIRETARTTHAALQRDFGIAAPRIAVAGLNPHAGESGSIGREDHDVIAPALAALRRDGLAISGPHSADTLFHPAARARYDAVIAMYHDQALIPLKTLAFDRGVNVTLGLPFARTSPDHGTAFDIAGRGTASPESLIAALRMADAIARRRAAAPAA